MKKQYTYRYISPDFQSKFKTVRAAINKKHKELDALTLQLAQMLITEFKRK